MFRALSLLLLFISAASGLLAASTDSIIKNNINVASYAIDTEASAIILFEKRQVTIISDNAAIGRFHQVEIIHRIIKILKKNAISVASVAIPYEISNSSNYIASVRGTTYTSTPNGIETTELRQEDIFKKFIAGNSYEMTFSLPKVKEGSIIDYSYVLSEQFDGDEFSWHVQGQYPKLVSEFVWTKPGNLEFTMITHVRGTQQVFATAQAVEDSALVFGIATQKVENANETFFLRRNIEALPPEPLVINRLNLMERIEFQCTGFANNNFRTQHFNNSWSKINEEFWEKAEVSKEIGARNGFLGRVTDSIIDADTSEMGRIHGIYSYVRSHYTIQSGGYSLLHSVNLLDVFNARTITAAQQNYLLIAMLVHAGIHASPIILGVAGRMPMSATFPVMSRIGYTACAVKTADTGFLLLDASNKNNCFGLLRPRYYNGYAYVLGAGKGVELTSASIRDKQTVSVRVFNISASGAQVEIIQKFGLLRSAGLRRSFNDQEDAPDKFLKQHQKTFSQDIIFLSGSLDNLGNPDTNLVARYSGELRFDSRQPALSIPSTLSLLFDSNPFKAAARKLPIEFSEKSDISYVLTIQLPAGVQTDSLPKPAQIRYEDNALVYKRATSYYKDLNAITVNSVFSINNTTFEPVAYNDMRSFFQAVLDDNARFITLKRTSAK